MGTVSKLVNDANIAFDSFVPADDAEALGWKEYKDAADYDPDFAETPKQDFINRVQHYRKKEFFFGSQSGHGAIMPVRFDSSQDSGALDTTAFGAVDALLDKHGKDLTHLDVDPEIDDNVFTRIRTKALALNPKMVLRRSWSKV
jgi:hypothetical protein